MTHGDAWVGMGWIWFYWSLPVLIAIVVILAWRFATGRSRNRR